MFDMTVEDVRRLISVRLSKLESIMYGRNGNYGAPQAVANNMAQANEDPAIDTDVLRGLLAEIDLLTRELDRLTGPQ